MGPSHTQLLHLAFCAQRQLIFNAGRSSSVTRALRRRILPRHSTTSQSDNGGTGVTRTSTTSTLGSKLSFTSIAERKHMSSRDFEGKAVLVVNTASLCGLTPQLKEMELVYKRFRDDGLVVLGVPSNDFGEQEPWDESKIREFYHQEFGVTFPLTCKTRVLGPEAHPFYSAAVEEFGPDVGPQWNFHKLLVGPDGTLSGGEFNNFRGI